MPEETTFPVLSPLTLISKALPSKLSTALQPSESKLQFNVRWQQFYEAASLPLSLLFCTAGSEAGEVCATKGWNDGTVGWGMKGGLQLFWLKPLQEPLLHCLKSLAAHQFQPSEMAAAMHHITNTLYALTATVILGLRMEIFLQRHAHHAKAFQNANEDAFVRRWQGQWGEMKHVMRPQNKEGCVKELLSATLGLIPLAESIVKELQGRLPATIALLTSTAQPLPRFCFSIKFLGRSASIASSSGRNESFTLSLWLPKCVFVSFA